MNRRPLVSLCSIVVVTFLLIASPRAAAIASGSDLAERIDAIAADTLAQPGAAGLSVAVARGGEIVLAKGYGLADVESRVPMTERSMLRIGSVTKQYTAAIILKLAEDGELSLDDPLTKYVEYPTDEHAVTIRHLLNHTSGIHSYTSVEEFWTMHKFCDLSDDELLAIVRDKPFDFAPGEKFLYNNTGYYLLGMVIEKVTGESYSEALRTRLFEALGLDETRYDVCSQIVPHRARGYTLGQTGLANAAPIGMRNPGAAGGLLATASDLVRWQQHLVAGRVVNAESFAMMTQPTILADESSEPYGFGLAMVKRHDRACISHGGGINGFSSMLMYFPDDDLHVAVISNSEAVNAGRPAMRIAGAVLGVEERPLEDLPVSGELIERIAGTYLIEGIDLEIRVFGAGENVIARATGQMQFKLMHQGGGVFRTLVDPSLRMTFSLGGDEDDESPAKSFVLEQGGMTFNARRIEEASGPD